MTDPTICNVVGGSSAICGLVCFGLSSTYKHSFGKLGIGGIIVYLLLCLMVWLLIVRGKRIRVSEKFQGLVAAVIFVVICVISVVHDKLVTEKSDSLTIISYGLFSLMSLSMSRNLELGFETGFTAFFLQLFAAQLFKINWILLPIALVFCFPIIVLLHCSKSPGEHFSQPNGYHPIEVVSQNESQTEMGVVGVSEEILIESGQVSGQSLSVSSMENSEQSNQEPSQAMDHSLSNGQVSEESMSDWDIEQNNHQEETSSSFPDMLHSPSNYGHVSDRTMLDWDNHEQNNEEEDPSSPYTVESRKQDEGSPANYTVMIYNDNESTRSSPGRNGSRNWMTTRNRNVSGSVRGRWPPQVASAGGPPPSVYF